MDDHVFCRAHLRMVMAEVKKHTTAEERKAAHAWRSGGGRGSMGDNCDFNGPGGFYWWGRKCCVWSARAHGWEAYLDKQAEWEAYLDKQAEAERVDISDGALARTLGEHFKPRR